DYHPVFLRWLLDNDQKALIPDALGVSSTGLDVLRTYEALVHALIDEAIWPETAQAVYGLALLLERGILYAPPVAPALWRQLRLNPSENAEAVIAAGCGSGRPASVFL
ncbi:MAG: hypothetical protein GWO12_17220, partial [Gemmatimonadetes bacterium]|nr:hypothetical protein [Candidatus Kutchimonas denitrificans]